jgi:phosphate transport system substrate-binding protein
MEGILQLKAIGALVGLAIAAAQPAGAQQITGAGATFPAPVYQKWGEAAKAAAGIELNYQAIGSGGGINQITNRTVDFGASDAPLSAEKLAQANLMQFPTVMGGIVLTINVPGVADKALKLTGPLVADIFQGKVTRWNDRRIAELNPGVTLPNIPVAPVYRADASGTTFQFTDYLGRVSDEWKAKVGSNTSVRWPAGVGARGNDGVAGAVRNTRGGIGYVEYAYAKLNSLTTTQLQNRDGHFVQPTEETFQAAAANADWSADPNFGISLNNQPGANSWPITAPTFILVPTNATDPARARNVLRFFDWAFRDGDKIADELVYIPLPEATKNAVRAAWAQRMNYRGS